MARVLELLRARARPSIGIALVCVGVLLAVVLATGGSDDPTRRLGPEARASLCAPASGWTRP